ncbi:MAG TPA: hypothetical protein ENI76_02235 [Ignavibacteria bacterium]|nr:hypothetical protein [Ignavibacteria bacterium]
MIKKTFPYLKVANFCNDRITKIILLTTCFVLISSLSYSQTVFEPINSSVYQFLDRMAQKGLIRFEDNIKPVSRLYIAKKLNELSNKFLMNQSIHFESEHKLTALEREELKFYLKDYGMELREVRIEALKNSGTDRRSKNNFHTRNSSYIQAKQSHYNIISKDPFNRWRLFSYSSNLFKLNVSPILGYKLGTREGAKYSHRWNGIYLYGYLGDNIGFSFKFKDNSENGSTVDRTKEFTPTPGVIIAKSNANHIEYSEINVDISYNWKWGDISIAKDNLEWGYGQSGKIVLSDKAPSFPFIRLDIHPTSWLRFNYIHAWLNSDVIDSSSLYRTYLPGEYRDQFRKKYFASHTLTVTPFRGLDISLGESIVYSDRLEIAYLIPIMFFRAADHYLSQANNNAGSNSQFFMGISSRNQIKNTHLYGTLFIDELTLEGLFNPQKQRNQFGFTLGSSVTDFPFNNVTFTLEYTKIFPYVYTHYIPTQTYQSSGYVMGHWMGNNADLVYGAINYRFIRGLQATLWGQYIRKGAAGAVKGQYTQPQPPFLFGLRTNYTYFGFDVKYEFIHELYAGLQYKTTMISKEQLNHSFINNKMNEFYFSLYYGF